jgi:response regulator RpfG family c-di-GMP phosphodiesterase
MNGPAKRETEVLPLLQKHAVLCVDDEPSILAALRRTLCREPYDLLMTESPSHALRYVETRPISLVLTDQRMPDMSGIEMLQAIHEHSPATTGVILTGFPESISRHGGFGEEVRCVLVKPWNNQVLTRTLRQLLREMELSGIHPSVEESREPGDLGGEA